MPDSSRRLVQGWRRRITILASFALTLILRNPIYLNRKFVATVHEERARGNVSETIALSPPCLGGTGFGTAGGFTANNVNGTMNLRRYPSERRLRVMHPQPGRKFSYVHISKCAGNTWIRIMGDLGLDMYPTRGAGQEHTVSYQDELVPDADYRMTTLRSPRHHVHSMFMMCKCSAWGRGASKDTFPRSAGCDSASGNERDFRSWLDHFLPLGSKRRDYYNCYHPANYQSRAFTMHAIKVHGVGNGIYKPDLARARDVYDGMDFVGLAEFVHESRCLFYYRLGCRAPPRARSYIAERCRCANARADDEDAVHVTHYDAKRRPVLRDLDATILSRLGALTTVDSAFYGMALREFMVEMAWLESSAALGRRVLCDDVLRRLEPELEYLAERGNESINVTQLYMQAIRDLNKR